MKATNGDEITDGLLVGMYNQANKIFSHQNIMGDKPIKTALIRDANTDKLYYMYSNQTLERLTPEEEKFENYVMDKAEKHLEKLK